VITITKTPAAATAPAVKTLRLRNSVGHSAGKQQGDFRAGIALCVELIKAGKKIVADGLTNSVELNRKFRPGQPHNNFALPFVKQLLARPQLVEGFAGALSNVFGYDGTTGTIPDEELSKLRYSQIAKARAAQPVDEEKATVYSMLTREREFYTAAWSILHELQLQGALPAWVKERFPLAGSHVENEQHRVAEEAVNRALEGDFPAARYVYSVSQSMNGDSKHTLIEGETEVYSGSALGMSSAIDFCELTPRQLQGVARAMQVEQRNGKAGAA
jgi:hypothetical protein